MLGKYLINQVEGKVRIQVGNKVRDVKNPMCVQVCYQVRIKVGSQLWGQVWDNLRNQIYNQVWI